MTIVNPNLPTNLFQLTSLQPVSRQEVRQLDLRLEQIVRVTVVEGGMDEALLDLNHQQFKVRTDQELQAGQQLLLQVLKTHPRFEFQTLNASLNDRLQRLLPLLTKPYDWGRLVESLKPPLEPGSFSPLPPLLYGRLLDLLTPHGPDLPIFRNAFTEAAAGLRMLAAQAGSEAVGLPEGSAGFFLNPASPGSYLPGEAATGLSRSLTEVLKNIREHLLQLPKSTDQPLPEKWHARARELLLPVSRDFSPELLSEPMKQQLFGILREIMLHPRVSPQLAAEIEAQIAYLERRVLQVVQLRNEPARSMEPAVISERFATVRPQSGEAQEKLQPLISATESVISQARQVLEQKNGLPPELFGRLEGLLARLKLLQEESGVPREMAALVEPLVNQLTQLTSAPMIPANGQSLGVLSQLFGFYLEAELLQEKQEAALASLKAALLNLRKQSGDDLKEPLRRLELFQLCKARFAEEQVVFLPLPFNELEEGYLLAGKQAGREQDEGERLQMSLSLRLSALGNMRIDMLYDRQGLQLRIACENQEKMAYLQSSAAELQGALQSIRLQGLSFSADAQLPARQLQQRLCPDSLNMLDERI